MKAPRPRPHIGGITQQLYWQLYAEWILDMWGNEDPNWIEEQDLLLLQAKIPKVLPPDIPAEEKIVEGCLYRRELNSRVWEPI